MQTKVCTKCGQEKPLDEFYTTIVGDKQYHRRKCKKCHLYKNAEWYKNNSDYRLEVARRYNKTEAGKAASKRRDKKQVSSGKRKEQLRRYRESLHDLYMKNCLKIRCFTTEQITPELIRAQRAMVLAKRTIKEIA